MRSLRSTSGGCPEVSRPGTGALMRLSPSRSPACSCHSDRPRVPAFARIARVAESAEALGARIPEGNLASVDETQRCLHDHDPAPILGLFPADGEKEVGPGSGSLKGAVLTTTPADPYERRATVAAWRIGCPPARVAGRQVRGPPRLPGTGRSPS